MGYDPAEAAREAAEEAFWEQLPKELHEDAVRAYLGGFGDAIDARFSSLVAQSKALLDAGHLGPALTTSATALEVIIHYFCVRPLVEGAFLSELWASTLAEWIVRTRPSEQRTLLLGILGVWKIDLPALKLSDGKPLWDTVHNKILIQRNRFVHEGEVPSKEDVVSAMDCNAVFRRDVVGAIAKKLGFTIEKTGKWAEVVRESSGPGHLGGGTKYVPRNPFRT